MIVAALALLLSTSAQSQIRGARTASGCINVRGDAEVTVTGRLKIVTLPGPPNYQDIAAGDAAEEAFILELRELDCVDDGGEFADSSEVFTTVHVFSSELAIISRLRAAVGRRVSITGEAFAAHTAHHRAPLVVAVGAVRVR